jgi:cation diffusion facilitator CzcD-associated flavoprotein CzcO
LNSSTYYDAVADPKTKLITEGIARLTPDGIVTADGVEHKVDVIVYATGFHVSDSFKYVEVKGLKGEDLGDRWNREGPVAHRGTTVADMPNVFFVLGPNTGLGHNSMVYMIESQIHYVAEAIKAADKAGVQALAPTHAAQDAFNTGLQERLGHSVWNTGGCASWYLDEHGNNRVLWGGYTWEYRLATRRFKPSEYRFFGAEHHDALV